MYLVVSLLVAVASQSAWTSPVNFPNDGKGDVLLPGVYFNPAPKGQESKMVPAIISFGVTGTDDSPLLVMNISAEMVGNNKETETLRLVLPINGVHFGGNATAEIAAEISEKTQVNDTLIDSEVSNNGTSNKGIEGKDSEIPSMDMENVTESGEYYYYYYEDDYDLTTEIPTVNEPIQKSMKFNSDSTTHLPSDGAAEMIFFNDEIRKPADKMVMYPTTRSPVHPNPTDGTRYLPNSQLMYPTPRSPVHPNPTEGTGNLPNSPVFNPCAIGSILYQGECHQVLSSDPCGEDKWLVMKTYETAQCELRPCPLGEILYQDKCVHPDNSNICPMGQMLYVEMTGIAFCDCDPDYIYFPQHGTCIPEYEQGWCPWGEYLVRNRDGIPECEQNPCGITGSVYYVKNRKCYKKNYYGHCEQELIEIKENKAECKEINYINPLGLRNVFEVPSLRHCPKGSLRDLLHECRRRFNMPSMPSVLKAKHLYGGCPSGWTKAPGRKCKRIVNLFAGRK